MLDKKLKIFVAGHRGLVGSAIHRKLLKEGYENIVTRSSKELDLRDQAMVNKFFEIEKPDLVFLAAAKVGGIHANNVYRGQFLYDNLMIQTNIIHASYVNQVQKLLFLGSSCIYPKHAHQPMSESELLTGVLEKTNEPYAIAKIAGIKMCEAYRAQYGCNFISAMPTNLYGLNDNYDLANSHVLPALIRKIHQAKKQNDPNVVIWGTGKPLREFLHVDDLADACLFLMEKYNEADFVNVGVGEEISILDLTILIKRIIGYEGEIINDLTKPDGTPRKLMSVDKISALGWKAKISLEEGIRGVYNSLENETWY
jgi:GDP-L-fucose synthase